MRHRADENQEEIAEALRRVGYLVAVTSQVGSDFPDLVVCRNKRTVLVEVKVPGEDLTGGQAVFHAMWGQKGHIIVVHDICEAIELLNGIITKGN